MKRLVILIAILLPSFRLMAQLPNKQVTSAATDQVESSVAVNPKANNELVGVWSDWELRSPDTLAEPTPGIDYSTDGGVTWTSYTIYPFKIGTSSYQYTTNPAVSFDNYGNVYIAIEYTNTLISGKDYPHDANIAIGEATFPPSSSSSWTWTSIDASGFDDRPFLAIDNTGGTADGTLYVTWTEFPVSNSYIYFTKHPKGGTFSRPDSIAWATGGVAGTNAQGFSYSITDTASLTSSAYSYVQGSIPVVAPDGSVYVTWRYGVQDTSRSTAMMLRRDSAGTWSSPITVANSYFEDDIPYNGGAVRYNNLPTLAVGSDGYVYVSFFDKPNTNATGHGVLKFYYSSAPTSVAFTSTNLGQSATTTCDFPWLTVNGNGQVILSYYDSKDSGQTYRTHLQGITNDGTTVGTPVQVSNTTFVPKAIDRTFDYLDMVSIDTANKMFMVWTDGRNGTASVPNGDIYFASASVLSANNIYSWNMLSIADSVANDTASFVFPGESTVDTYTGSGYAAAGSKLSNDTGYWVEMPTSAISMYQVGHPQYTGPMLVHAGWNIIGSVSEPVATSSVSPSGNIASSFYTYLAYNGGYAAVTTLTPELGFYVKVTLAGAESLKTSAPKVGGEPISGVIAAADKFTFTDARGFQQSFYFRNKPIALDKTLGVTDDGNDAMPPPPPFDIFSAYPSTGNYIQSVDPQSGQNTYPIVLKSPVYPVRLNWEMRGKTGSSYSLLLNGKQVSAMRGTGSYTIPKSQTVSFQVGVGSKSVPLTYALNQNYPNPFNPTTSIVYQLPSKSKVSLKVFDVLGKEVATLVNGEESAGSKTVQFNGENLASGVYFYRLSTGTFMDVKRMTLIK